MTNTPQDQENEPQVQAAAYDYPPATGIMGRIEKLVIFVGRKMERASDYVQMSSGSGSHASDPLVDGAQKAGEQISSAWNTFAPKYLPFADAASEGLPLNKLLRLSLFQISVGMAMVLLTGTLNRVMVVEMGISAWVIAVMVAIPILFAPFRVIIGHKSDTYRSFLGWRRVPFIWFGTMAQFLGLGVMPFSIMLLTGDGGAFGADLAGYAGAIISFFLVGIGFHTTQTAGLALATDLAEESKRPRVVAFLYMVLLIGMIGSALFFGWFITPAEGEHFTYGTLAAMLSWAALATVLLNVVALWKQEARNPDRTDPTVEQPSFRAAWAEFSQHPNLKRLLKTIFLGTAAFSMQDILLEPYGGEVLGLSVGATTVLTAFFAFGSLVAFGLSARVLEKGIDPCRLSMIGVVFGIFAFAMVILSNPFDSPMMYRIGSVFIGFGGGFFAVGTLTAALSLANDKDIGLTLGVWGAVQATAMGGATVLGGVVKDILQGIFSVEFLGIASSSAYIGYAVVYTIEIVLLIATLRVILPLARHGLGARDRSRDRFGIAGLPG